MSQNTVFEQSQVATRPAVGIVELLMGLSAKKPRPYCTVRVGPEVSAMGGRAQWVTGLSPLLDLWGTYPPQREAFAIWEAWLSENPLC